MPLVAPGLLTRAKVRDAFPVQADAGNQRVRNSWTDGLALVRIPCVAGRNGTAPLERCTSLPSAAARRSPVTPPGATGPGGIGRHRRPGAPGDLASVPLPQPASTTLSEPCLLAGSASAERWGCENLRHGALLNERAVCRKPALCVGAARAYQQKRFQHRSAEPMSYCSGPMVGSACSEMGLPMKR